MTAPKWPKWDWYDLIHMSETRVRPFRLEWLQRLNQSLEWYDWDAPDYCRRYFKACFLTVSLYQVYRFKKPEQNSFEHLSLICASLGQGVSVISVSTVSFVLIHITLAELRPNSEIIRNFRQMENCYGHFITHQKWCLQPNFEVSQFEVSHTTWQDNQYAFISLTSCLLASQQHPRYE